LISLAGFGYGTPMDIVSIPMRPEMRRKFKRLCIDEGVTMSATVRGLVKQHMRKLEKERREVEVQKRRK
jgi:hypothetical protein